MTISGIHYVNMCQGCNIYDYIRNTLCDHLSRIPNIYDYIRQTLCEHVSWRQMIWLYEGYTLCKHVSTRQYIWLYQEYIMWPCVIEATYMTISGIHYVNMCQGCNIYDYIRNTLCKHVSRMQMMTISGRHYVTMCQRCNIHDYIENTLCDHVSRMQHIWPYIKARSYVAKVQGYKSCDIPLYEVHF